jgi:hypothetical protein
MAKDGTHRRQRGKNFVLLAILLALVAGLYYLTILKIRGA